MAKMLKRLESEARVLIVGSLVMCCDIAIYEELVALGLKPSRQCPYSVEVEA